MTAVIACRILGVPSRTTWSDVRQAYLDLVKVWHPDRFQSEPSLQARAAKRLAEINEAYEFLRDVHMSRKSSNASRPRTAPKPSPTPQTSNTESSPPRPPENAHGQQARAEPPSRPIPDAGQTLRRVSLMGVIVALAVLVVFGVFLGTQEGFAPSSSADAPDAATLEREDRAVAEASGRFVKVSPVYKADPLTVYTPTDRPSSIWEEVDAVLRSAPPPQSSRPPPPAPTPLRTRSVWEEADALLRSAPRPLVPLAPGQDERLRPPELVYAQTVPGVERPESGAELIVTAETGLGSLNVRNGTNPDAVVILYQGDVQRRAAYIRASNAAAIPKVAAGTYNVRFTSGRWWNGEEFLKEATFSEFERPLVFAETQEEDGIAYSDFKLTLNRVIGGNARTRPTPPFKLSKQIPLEGR